MGGYSLLHLRSTKYNPSMYLGTFSFEVLELLAFAYREAIQRPASSAELCLEMILHAGVIVNASTACPALILISLTD